MPNISLGKMQEAARARAAAEGKTLSELIRAALAAYLDAGGRNAGNLKPKKESPGGENLVSLTTPLTADQVTALDARAKAEGTFRTRLIRAAITQYMTDRNLGALDTLKNLTKDLVEIRGELGRIGGNLNQVAQAFNMTDELNDMKLAMNHRDLRTQFRALAELVKEVSYDLKKLQR